ncbi:MAG TPA: helix-turn-helix transcriptional regulator [Solirubrobacterales bacterium]|nr:helix-turn-helix transcriptional regulator [Solirubrobacterales bacterium]
MTVTQQRIQRRPLKAPGVPNHRLRELRRNRGWSREKLGFEAGGVHHKTIGDIEEGRTQRPQARTMFLLAQALGTTVTDLEGQGVQQRS